MTAPLDGVRVVEYTQYVAGPLCGLLLSDLGADVVKVEPPAGDGYRRVMPVGAGLGRFFVPLNRGKRSVVLDLKTSEGRRRSARLVAGADIVLHNYPSARAEAFGLGPHALRERHRALVVGVVSAFGREGPLADLPAYDLVAQARAGLLTAHASVGDRVPVRAGGIPIADLTAGFLLAAGVLAALVRASRVGEGDTIEVSLLAAAFAVQIQDLVTLAGEPASPEPLLATSVDLDSRASKIARDTAINPYYRCYAAADGYLALACLNLAQRVALLDLVGLDDATVEAPDVVPVDGTILEAKHAVTIEIERMLARGTVKEWVVRLGEVGVPAGPVFLQASALADAQARANGFASTIDQPGLGNVSLLGPLYRIEGESSRGIPLRPAPALGQHTEEVLAAL